MEISFYLLRRLLGVKTDGGKKAKVQKLTAGEILMVNIGSTSSGGKVRLPSSSYVPVGPVFVWTLGGWMGGRVN